MNDLTRLTVNLNAETLAALNKIANSRGCSYTEAVRRCISVYNFIDGEAENGRTITTQRPDGTEVRELVLL